MRLPLVVGVMLVCGSLGLGRLGLGCLGFRRRGVSRLVSTLWLGAAGGRSDDDEA
jgi:hypothetical protein